MMLAVPAQKRVITDPFAAYLVSSLDFSSTSDAIAGNTWTGTLSGSQLSSDTLKNTESDQSRFNIHTGDFSIRFLYTPSTIDNNGSNHGLLSFGDGTLSGVGYFVRYNGGIMLVSYPSSGGSAEIPVYNGMTLTTGQQYEVVIQCKLGVYDILIDGISVVTARNNAAKPYFSSSHKMCLGALDVSGFPEYMMGAMDDFKFYQGVAAY